MKNYGIYNGQGWKTSDAEAFLADITYLTWLGGGHYFSESPSLQISLLNVENPYERTTDDYDPERTSFVAIAIEEGERCAELFDKLERFFGRPVIEEKNY